MHWNPETLMTFFSSSMTRLLIFFLTFSFSTRGERDTIFTMLTVPTSPFSQLPSWTLGPESESQLTDPTNTCTSCIPQTGLALPSFKFQLASPRDKSQQTAFSKITKIPSPSLPDMTSFTPQSHFLSGVFIITFVIVTSSVCECELYSMCAPACALSQIVLSLTKPNDKI